VITAGLVGLAALVALCRPERIVRPAIAIGVFLVLVGFLWGVVYDLYPELI
jgi:hypothetical protein